MVIDEIIGKWRKRLIDISWFMRGINEYIARKANKEDKCKGRFWEGCFKSQALLDEEALLTYMAYVDLNPIRAKMADSIESSEYTSGYERIQCNLSAASLIEGDLNLPTLFGFVGDMYQQNPDGLTYSLIDYIELLDWTGRVIRPDKRGSISANHPLLLHSLGIDEDSWIELASSFGQNYQGSVGSLEELALFAAHTGKCWIASKNALRRCLH